MCLLENPISKNRLVIKVLNISASLRLIYYLNMSNSSQLGQFFIIFHGIKKAKNSVK